MARDYDNQLLESVAVRRQRLREAVLFGGQRTRRRLDENIGKVVISACLAAVACGATVGWSFVSSTLSDQRIEQEQAASGPAADAVPELPGGWIGTEVTLDTAREELDAAGVPESLYVLPGDTRPAPGTLDSYYLLAETAEGDLHASVIDFDQGRTGLTFRTEDEAARWLYRELATTEADPAALDPAGEREAAEATAELVTEVRDSLAERSGDAYRHTLEVGTLVDAFGQESGRLLSPDGTPFTERGLPEYTRTGPDGEDLYHRYRVIHPFQVSATTAPPSGSVEGGGVRFTLDGTGFGQATPAPTVRWLIGHGYLERIAVDDIPS
ncbi:TNT domain-containing protein [Nocardiopsis sp. LOL_012]|uniref:TNT domain-containing protein n=1 Tax=Nocardiopsis sp. LOL_012 TaxID=3345409 RepID=UPI003A8658E0